MEQDQNDVNHGKHRRYLLESKHAPLAPKLKKLINKAINQIYQHKLNNNIKINKTRKINATYKTCIPSKWDADKIIDYLLS
jgi:hypothetical protein